MGKHSICFSTRWEGKCELAPILSPSKVQCETAMSLCIWVAPLFFYPSFFEKPAQTKDPWEKETLTEWWKCRRMMAKGAANSDRACKCVARSTSTTVTTMARSSATQNKRELESAGGARPRAEVKSSGGWEGAAPPC